MRTVVVRRVRSGDGVGRVCGGGGGDGGDGEEEDIWKCSGGGGGGGGGSEWRYVWSTRARGGDGVAVAGGCDYDVGWVERALGGSNFVRKRLLRQVTAEQQRAGRAAEQGRTQQTCVGSRLASRISPEHVGDRHPFDQSNPIVFTESTFLSFIYVPFLLSFPHFEPCLPLHNCQVPHLDSLHLRPRRPLVERSHKVRDVRIRALRLAGDAVVRSVTDPAADGETVGDLVGEGTAGRLAHRCSAMRGRKTVVPEEDAWLG